jgi:hypothetical protein
MRRRISVLLFLFLAALAVGRGLGCRKKEKALPYPGAMPTRYAHYPTATPVKPGQPTPIPDEPQ